MPKVYIIILNWNGWKDTIECLESVFSLKYKFYQVVVCDNNSNDNSMDKIKEWAEGKIEADVSCLLSGMKCHKINKPIKYKEIDKIHNGTFIKEKLVLIQIEINMGFAFGNNIGIFFALNQGDAEYIWILNNDTVVDNAALYELVNKMKKNDNVGICGSKLIYYDNPQKIQALGGKYNKFFGRSRHVVDESKIDNIDYVVGASMLVSKSFINEVGYMDESYFLYFEEIDWALRAKYKYKLLVSLKSIVYHKEGSSTGSKEGGEISKLSDYYSIRNRIIITKRYFKRFLPFVYIGILKRLFYYLIKLDISRIKNLLNAILDSRNIV